MDKKEILEKAQLEYTDTGDEKEIEEEGRNGILEFISFFILAITFMVIKISHGHQIFDYIATIFYVIAVLGIIRFVKLKKHRYLIISLVSIVIAVITTIMFFKSYDLI